MTVASLIWRKAPVPMPRTQLGIPLAVYLCNLAFGAVLSLAGGFYMPVALGTLLGFIPALVLYAMARPSSQEIALQLEKATRTELESPETAKVPMGVMSE